MGLHRAGFDVVGVDIVRQPKYPFRFIQCHWLVALATRMDWDFIWASPVCKRYSSATRTSGTTGNHPDDIQEVREKLEKCWPGIPYCIENVAGAPLENPFMLCGTMFGLPLYRHRYFETSLHFENLVIPQHREHENKTAKMGRPLKPGEFINPVGHFSDVAAAQKAMGIDWLGQKELSQAIPPAYSEFIGRHLTKERP